jgi:ABC-type glycerol-3-phosphate transport system permease component
VSSAEVIVPPDETGLPRQRTISRGRPGAVPSRPAKVHLASVSRGSVVTRAGAFVLGTLWLGVVLVPIYYMVLTSFRSQGQYLTANAWLPTGGLSLSSWAAVFSSTGLWRDFINSVIYSAGTIVLVVAVSLVAAFRIVRRGSRFAAISFNVILFGLAVPIQALLIPNYVIMVKLHLYDTLYGLVLVTAASLVAISVLLTVNYVRMIPDELYDAMAIDGASERVVFARLVWPMARPVLGVVAIFAGLAAWNNFILPLILTESNSNAVLPLGLYTVSTTSSGYGVSVPIVMAGVIFSLLPVLFLFLAMRRQFVKGIGGFALR